MNFNKFEIIIIKKSALICSQECLNKVEESFSHITIFTNCGRRLATTRSLSTNIIYSINCCRVKAVVHLSIFLFHFSLYVCDLSGALDSLLAHSLHSVVGGMVIVVVIHMGGLSRGVLGVDDL